MADRNSSATTDHRPREGHRNRRYPSCGPTSPTSWHRNSHSSRCRLPKHFACAIRSTPIVPACSPSCGAIPAAPSSTVKNVSADQRFMNHRSSGQPGSETLPGKDAPCRERNRAQDRCFNPRGPGRETVTLPSGKHIQSEIMRKLMLTIVITAALSACGNGPAAPVDHSCGGNPSRGVLGSGCDRPS
jgi:hypothetical protein